MSGQPWTPGCLFMEASFTNSALYPSDGQGGTTATASASILASAKEVVLYALEPYDASSSPVDITLVDKAGASVRIWNEPTALTAVQVWRPGGAKGMLLLGNNLACFGIKLASGSLNLRVYFRIFN